MTRRPETKKRIPDPLIPAYDGFFRNQFGPVHLNLLHSKYLTTQNPLYAWAAISWCRSDGAKDPIPEWCIQYFVQAGDRLNSLMPTDFSPETGGKGRDMMGQVPTASEMTAALGLTSNGRNAFRDAWSESRSARAAVHYADLRRAGQSAKEALESVRGWLGVSDEDQARKIMKEGKRLLSGKTYG